MPDKAQANHSAVIVETKFRSGSYAVGIEWLGICFRR